MNKQSVNLPGSEGAWGSYISKYQPDSSKVLDNMFTAGSKNFVTDQTGMIQKSQGGVQWNRTSFSEPAKDSYEAIFESGARHFLRVGNGTLTASTGTGLFDTITSGYSALGNFEWVTYQNRAYGCNGVNAPQTYDVATSYGGVTYTFTTGKTKAMGAQAPTSAPTAGTPTSGGAVPVGGHKYKVTFMYYDSEESNGSPASSVQNATGGSQTIPLTAIPVGGYGVTARNIYRDNNDGVYLLLDTIADNTTTTYSDILLIGSTPTPLPLFNDLPPTFSKVALWLDSIFIAPTGEPNTVRFSNAGSPDTFDPGNFVTCQSDDIVTALYVYNGKLYVFGLHSFGSIEGNTPDTFSYRNISNIIGCVDNRSIQVRSIVSVPTLWWLSDKGMYYSNGNTVEYGSDLIQDLVNLNLAQVNYSTNRNVQTSQADFAGDTRTPGIDIATSPGSVMTINPKQEYSTNTDWLGGSSLTNCKTSDGDFLEVPTQFAPTLGQGTLTGSAQISGTNLVLPQTSNYTGETSTAPRFQSGYIEPFGFAKSFIPTRTGTIDSFYLAGLGFSGRGNTSATVTITPIIWNDALGTPGASQWVGTSHTSLLGISAPIEYPGISLSAGTKYWLGYTVSYNQRGGVHFYPTANFSGGDTKVLLSSWISESGSPPIFPSSSTITVSFTSVPASSSGSWISPIYDSGSATAVSSIVTESGTYPVNCSGNVTVLASNDPLMVGAVSQSFSNPNGINSLSLVNYRYWQITASLLTTDNRTVPVMGNPSLKFNTAAEWISQPIDTTIDKTAWGTLAYTGNIPLGTSVTLTIATSASQFSGYSSYGAIGSAALDQWAKVKVALTTSTDNVTSPAIASVTLTWDVTSTITSSIIDSGTVPSGYNIFQREQLNPGTGTVLFYIRTAASAGAIPAASFVAVTNGEFPNLSALRYSQWKSVLSSTADHVPEITSVTVSWFLSSGASGVRCSSLFYNKTYYLTVATVGQTANNTVIQLDQFGNWRVQKDVSIGTFLSYFNTLYFTDGISGLTYNGFIADTNNGTPIVMDVRTKAWNSDNDLFLKVPRALKVTGLNTQTTLHAYYSTDRGVSWIELLNESGVVGYTTTNSGSAFTTLFVPDAASLTSGRTLMYRIVSDDIYPCSIINFVPSFYSRKGRYLSNG